MKKLLTILMAAGVLYSCNTNPNAYTIKGSVAQKELEGKTVLMNKLDYKAFKQITTDSAVISNGTYKFKGVAEKPELVFLVVPEGNKSFLMAAQAIIEGGKITVVTDADGRSRIGGTPDNDILQNHLDELSTLQAKADAITKALDNNPTSMQFDSLSNESRKVTNEMRLITLNFVKANINNPAGQSQIETIARLPLDLLEGVIASADSSALQHPMVAEVAKMISAPKAVAVGKPFIDAMLKDAKGKDVELSTYVGKGKYVLIDFWASWCAPCRKEMPNLKKAYAKYKSKGFEIIGISTDEKEDAWQKAVKDLGLSWPQVHDAYRDARSKYIVNAIPHTVILGPDGTIVAKNLREEELEKYLEKLFTTK